MNSHKSHLLRTSLAAVFATLFLAPAIMAVWGALMPLGEVSGRSVGLQRPDWSNFTAVFDTVPLVLNGGNSLLVAILGVLLSLLISSLAAFCIIEQPQPLRRWLVIFAIITMLVPPSAVWLFRFWLFDQIGLLDTRLALIFPALAGGNSLFVLIYFWAWMRTPAELFDAARIDGAAFLTRWWWVGLPLVRPATAAVALLAFTQFWGSFIEPLLFVFDPQKYTLPVALQLLNQLDSANRPLLLAGAVLVTIPAVILFAIAQRWFLQGEFIGE